MNRNLLTEALGKVFQGIPEGSLSGYSVYRGKVRDVVDLGDSLVIATSDRISAFDKVLSTIPFKGQVLNRIALFWFDATKDIIDNHIKREISARTVLADKCEVLPVEVIVRAYLTGSAWRDYEKGNPVSGIILPSGMKRDQAFDSPLITPSTKAGQGEHDMPISGEDVVGKGLVTAQLWKEVGEKALALFTRGTEIARAQGLILVDTKYEFGLRNGKLVIVDEIHTPDSSRYWHADSYHRLFAAGEDQRKVDKEFLRGWLMERNWMGEGEAPLIPDDIRVEVARRYIEAFELLTGQAFIPEETGPDQEMERILSCLG